MDKDYITIASSDGSTEEMEVVASFRLEETEKDCIIYKSLKDGKYYAASYEGDNEYVKLNTDFTDKEKEQLNEIFEALKMGGETNA